MTEQPKIRDLHHEYLDSRIPFEDLVEVANRSLERNEAEQVIEDDTTAAEPPRTTPAP